MRVLTREQLLSELPAALLALESELDAVSARGLLGAIAVDEWSVRDVLSVRTRWAESVAEWIAAGLRGENPVTPAPGYRWNETPRLNASFVADEAATSLESLRGRLRAAVETIIAQVRSLDERQLLEPQQFLWTRSWCVSQWVSMNTITQFASLGTMIRRLIRAAETSSR